MPWMCPRCQAVHSNFKLSCDCQSMTVSSLSVCTCMQITGGHRVPSTARCPVHDPPLPEVSSAATPEIIFRLPANTAGGQ